MYLFEGLSRWPLPHRYQYLVISTIAITITQMTAQRFFFKAANARVTENPLCQPILHPHIDEVLITHIFICLCLNDDVTNIWNTNTLHGTKNPFDNLLPYSRAVFRPCGRHQGRKISTGVDEAIRWSNLIERILQIHNGP